MIAAPHTAPRAVVHLNSERGVALAAAVFALAVIGALVASSFFAGRLEQQSGRSSFFAGQAREAAEAQLAEVTTSVPSETLEGLPVGMSVDLGTTGIGRGVVARTRITRLTSRLFLIRAEGERHDAAGAPLAARALGLLVRVDSAASVPAGEPRETATVARLAERGWVQLY